MNTANSKVSIIMYHYVREIKNSKYPNIKGLEIQSFKEQLDYLKRHYNFITTEQLINSFDSKDKLPPKAVLLTFDDGYADHYKYVFPELEKRKLQGSFYIPAKTILDSRILDVNKIHFILAVTSDQTSLIKKCFVYLDKYRNEYHLESNDYYINKLAKPTRFDSAEVVFFKRLLQKELNESLRNQILKSLFEETLNISESDFSKELYLSLDQLKSMIDNKMHIGHHGYDHLWLDSLNANQQEYEISEGFKFLSNLGVNMNYWSICYPYGAYNSSVLSILNKYNCKLGFTTHVDVADTMSDKPLTLPRLDTNDIPKSATSVPNDWFLKA